MALRGVALAGEFDVTCTVLGVEDGGAQRGKAEEGVDEGGVEVAVRLGGGGRGISECGDSREVIKDDGVGEAGGDGFGFHCQVYCCCR